MRTSLQFILTIAGATLLLGSLATPVRADILYVANFIDNTIEKFTSSGIGSVFVSLGFRNGPRGLAFDAAGKEAVCPWAIRTCTAPALARGPVSE